MLTYFLLGFSGIVLCVVWRKLYPKPYPGIPYVEASAKRISGDMPELMSVIRGSDEITDSMFAISTRKLGTPIAQVLFPRFRRPLIVLEDPLEVEDIMVRRQKQFDKSPMTVDIFAPMFPRATLSQYTTPQLKAQKRLWAEVMRVDFLRRAAAPRIYQATVELLDLWKLKASGVYRDDPFNVHDDFKNATLDAIWAAMVGQSPGATRIEIEKLQAQAAGDKIHWQAPRGAFIKAEVTYISEAISRNSKTPMPTWAQKLETWTPRHRKFRSTVIGEISLAMGKAADRFRRIEMGKLEADNSDTCMVDVVLRRRILETRKAGELPTDPAKDQNMLDEMFILLVGATFPGPQLPTYAEILDTEVPYLDGACEESLRLAGTSKGNLRQAVVDTEILGCRIPKGAEVLVNLHINRTTPPVDSSQRSVSSQAAIQKHGDCFSGAAGRDLGNFEPRRWLIKDEATGRDKFDAYAIPSLAFGGGYRGCFGRKLAVMEFRIIVVLLILNFEFLALPKELQTMRASEKLFRHPQMPFAKIKIL
ncbi:cytochrome P450 [Truncatella angustata]|uniref:Cytochrome P450 n=1 Tax=Truncatella angustata TaxID=152316 RepID=A0A9P8USU8_9PEZI|nr:cytochrome P450 [Truncatella angustata]KAH6658465.1 cytochrome P450 [Truncatella angustata]